MITLNNSGPDDRNASRLKKAKKLFGYAVRRRAPVAHPVRKDQETPEVRPILDEGERFRFDLGAFGLGGLQGFGAANARFARSLGRMSSDERKIVSRFQFRYSKANVFEAVIAPTKIDQAHLAHPRRPAAL